MPDASIDSAVASAIAVSLASACGLIYDSDARAVGLAVI